MQSKVLCLLFVALVASSVTAGSLGKSLESVSKKLGNDAKNASHRDVGDINVINIVLPPAPNVIQLPDVASSVDAAEQLLATTLGSVGNLVDALQNVVTAALRGVQPVADLLNILTQVVDAFSKVAAEEPLNVAVLVIKNGVQLVDAILEAVIPVVELNIVI